MDPLILSIDTHYDRFIESIADYLQAVDRLQRCNEEVKRVERTLFAADMRLAREIEIQIQMDGRSVQPSQADIENQLIMVEDAEIEKNDREIETVSALELKYDLELKKSNGLEHFKNCYENLKGALDSAEISVEMERRRLQMWLGEQASAALFNSGPSAEFDMTYLAQDFNSSPPIYEDVPPHGRPDAVLSEDSTDTFYVPPAGRLSQSPTDAVIVVPQEGHPHAVSAPPTTATLEGPTDTVNTPPDALSEHPIVTEV